MNIAIVGAFDRMNYGDILFPLILTKHLTDTFGQDINISLYGHVKSDLTEYGGFKTKPISLIFDKKNLPERSAIIIAGGEVLAASWNDAFHHIFGKRPWWLKVSKRIFGEKGETLAIRKRFGCKNSFPYIFQKHEFSIRPIIIYNSVGGSSLAKRSQTFIDSVSNALEDADYLSVRDQKSAEIIANSNAHFKNVDITPDCAAVLSKFYPVDEVTQHLSSEGFAIKNKLAIGEFIVFQIGSSFYKKQEHTIAEQLNKLAEATNKSIVLLPIGRAAGHEDHVALEKIAALLNKPAILPTSNTLYDTIWTISNSSLFIGTSLHGAITAASYGIPLIALTKKDPKIPAYLETWATGPQRECIEFNQIFNTAIRRLAENREDLRATGTALAEKAYVALNKIVDTLRDTNTRQT